MNGLRLFVACKQGLHFVFLDFACVGQGQVFFRDHSTDVCDVLARRVADLRAAGKFSEADERHIAQLSFSVTRDGFTATPERVELLRRLCQIYSADIRPQAPTSHRKIIGPFIVLGKRMLQPVINAVFGPALRNQREFNAHVVSLLTDLSNDAR